MTEKIEWYQEVLELEPSSKVFFPLAKLLAANNQLPDAISTLRQGLDRHPEFFEARLMLIDLLQQAGQQDNSLYEVERLGSKLMLYPGFWQAWAAVSENNGQNDEAIALRLLAAFLSGRDITLLDILQAGLKSTLAQSSKIPAPLIDKNKITPDSQPAASLSVILEKEKQTSPAQMPVGAEKTLTILKEQAPEITTPSAASTAVDEHELLEHDEEPFSLRTKTMASVLVEQGDLQGALEIYEELLAASSNPEKKADLQERVDELKAKIKNNEVQISKEESSGNEPLQGKKKLLDALEHLAKRLEIRAED